MPRPREPSHIPPGLDVALHVLWQGLLKQFPRAQVSGGLPVLREVECRRARDAIKAQARGNKATHGRVRHSVP
eukprot:15088582-Alexandrium_andersonii.AAC.1